MYMSDEDDDPHNDDRSGGGARMTVRDAWQKITSNLGRHNYEMLPVHKRSKVKQTLLKWRNPQPSVSIKHISNALSVEFNSDYLESSCFVDGFRIVQNYTGDIYAGEYRNTVTLFLHHPNYILWAEYCLIFAYGSRSFLNWKSYTEFNEYLKIVKDVHRFVFANIILLL